MTPEALWNTTPAELSAIAKAKRKEKDQEMQFYDGLNGVLCSLIANVNRGSGEPFRPADFMITRQEPEKKPVEDLNKKLMAWAAMSRIKHG